MNIFALISLFSALVAFSFGSIIISKNPRNSKNISFFILCFLSGLSALFEFELRTAETFETAYIWHKALTIWPLTISSSYYFITRFYKKTIFSELIAWSVHGTAVIIFMIDLTSNKISSDPTIDFWGWRVNVQDNIYTSIILIWIFVVALLTLFRAFLLTRDKKDKIKRKQGLYIFHGFLISFLMGIISDVFFSHYKISIPELSNTSSIIGYAFIAYAMVKYKLFLLTPSSVSTQIVETISGALILTDAQGKIVFFNKSTEKLFGLKKNQIKEAYINKLFKSEELQTNPDKIINSIRFNDVYLKNDKHEINLTINRICIRDQVKKPQGFVYLANDLDEMNQLSKAKVKAELTDRLKSEFLLLLYQEIRGPLNTILSTSETLIGSSLPDFKRNEQISSIKEKRHYLSNFITKIVEIVEIENNQVQVNETRCSLNSIVDQVQDETVAILTNSKVEIINEKGFSGKKDLVNIDQGKLKRTFDLLIETAINYTKQGIVKHGYFLADDNHIQFYVSSVGFEELDKDISKVLRLLTEKDYLQLRIYGLTGINFAIAKSYILLMNGKIWADFDKDTLIIYFKIPYRP